MIRDYAVLCESLKNDGFFQGLTELHIVDDAFLNNSYPDAIDSFGESFAGTDVRNIKIYNQAKRYPEWVVRDIQTWSDENGLDCLDVISFQALVGIPLRRKYAVTPDQWNEEDIRKARENSNKVIKFMAKLIPMDIDVRYQYYERLRTLPLLTGKYWLDPRGAGYVIDERLSSAENNTVFVQSLSPNNVEKIWNRLREGVVPQEVEELDLPPRVVEHMRIYDSMNIDELSDICKAIFECCNIEPIQN